MAKIPILSSEWGYASNTKGVSLETQAAFVVRQQLCNLPNGVPLSIWYDWKNDGHDPADNEQNFGTVKEDLESKPAYTALKTMTAELRGYRLERKLDGLSESDFILVFVNGTGARNAGSAIGFSRGVANLNARLATRAPRPANRASSRSGHRGTADHAKLHIQSS